MKRYRVVNSCVRMPFDRRYFKKDEVVDIPDDVDPGANFELLKDAPSAAEERKEDGVALSQLQKNQKKLSETPGGFANGTSLPEPLSSDGKLTRKSVR